MIAKPNPVAGSKSQMQTALITAMSSAVAPEQALLHAAAMNANVGRSSLVLAAGCLGGVVGQGPRAARARAAGKKLDSLLDQVREIELAVQELRVEEAAERQQAAAAAAATLTEEGPGNVES